MARFFHHLVWGLMPKKKYIFIYLLLFITLLICFPLFLVQFFYSQEPKILPESPVVSVMAPNGDELQLMLEEYVVGVVAAEMPASFEPEALKAQAIVARTYVLMHLPKPVGAADLNQDVTVSSNPGNFQAFITEEEMKERWHDQADFYLEKIRTAVYNTYGLVVTYNGEMVTTPYSSTCGGCTEDNADVWGSDLPWLQSVPCTWDEEAPRYHGEVEMTLKKAAQKLSDATNTNVNAQDIAKMKQVSKTVGGRVKEVKIGEKSYLGTQLRTAWGLNSTNFCWQVDGSNINFSTIGYGHGVGMCQYGANGMAKAGKTAQEILAYYYQGIKLTQRYGE